MQLKGADMHCDTISQLRKNKRAGIPGSLWENEGQVDLKRLGQKGYYLQNFALFVNMGTCTDPWEDVLELADLYEDEMAKYPEAAGKVLTYADIAQNEREGKISCLLTVEEGGVCKGDLEKLSVLYDKGVRMLTLTWNYPNELGYPNLLQEKGSALRARQKDVTEDTFKREIFCYLDTPDTQRGLTESGREFVQKMEDLGMIVDVSHLSDKGFYDVLSISSKPFVASHSNARAICPCARNLTDDMIRQLGNHGGIMGLNVCRDFLLPRAKGSWQPGDEGMGSAEALAMHARHICQVGGIQVLGLGSDFDGIDDPGELEGVQGMELLWDRLTKVGFHEREVDKIFSENVLNLYKNVL
jgi:membrane dipeptidase